MDADESFDAFDFNDDSIFNDEIGAMFSNQVSLVVDGYSGLSNKGDDFLNELQAQSLLVRGLQEPRTESPMHFHSAADDAMGKTIVCIRLSASLPRCVLINRAGLVRIVIGHLGASVPQCVVISESR